MNNTATVRAARDFAATRNHFGMQGGWIYDSNGTPRAHGRERYAAKFGRQIRDHVTRQITGFECFADLMATDERYSPTIMPRRGYREEFLADAFDRAAAARNQPRRAWRG